MKFKIREEEIMRRVMEYEIEADSLEEAQSLAKDGSEDGSEYFPMDDSILITIKDEKDEEVWSGDYIEL